MRIQKGLSIEQVLKKKFPFGSVFLTFTVFMSQEPSPPFKIGNENKKRQHLSSNITVVHMQDPFTTNDVTVRDLLFLLSAYPCFVVTPF